MSKKMKQYGGDGYVINVNESIGGMAGHTRYSYNYRPIFDGELLQNGGDGYSVDVKPEDVGGQPIIKRYTPLNTPVFNGNLLQQNGGCDTGCNNSSDPFVFDMIKQQGGKKIDQIHAIKKLSHILLPLSVNSLTKLNIKLFLNDETINNKQFKQYGGYLENLEQLIAPLGKNNLLVLASLLLLHHFAVDSKRSVETNKKILFGGNSFVSSISELLLPIEEKKMGTSKILRTLKTAFDNNKNDQKGGSQLKNLIAPLGKSAFIATGLLVILQKLFSDKIKEIKTTNTEKKVLIGGEVNKNFEKLYNLIGPITFNTFAKESFLKKMVINKKNNINNKS